MKTSRILTSIFVVFMISPTRVPGHVSEIRETNVQPVPEIKRLFVAFCGRLGYPGKAREDAVLSQWRGAQRQDAYSLGCRRRDAGYGGPLGRFRRSTQLPDRDLVDTQAKLYHYFTCFKDAGSGCEVRGTAHWEKNVFVNDYEEDVDGRKLKFRDTFQNITQILRCSCLPG
jgi:hypothetical protein